MFKYTLKIILNNKVALFWVLLFPIVLSTLFMFAFEGIKNADTFTSIEVAFVNPNTSEGSLYAIMDSINYESEHINKKMFILSELSLEAASEKLNNQEITAYIQEDTLFVYSNGMKETMVKTVVDTYYKKTLQFEVLIGEGASVEEAFLLLLNEEEFFERTGEKSSSLIENYYYSVLGMSVLLAATISLGSTAYILPNQSEVGKRMSLTPKKKTQLLTPVLLVNFVIMLIIFTIIHLYFRFVIGLVYHNVFEVVLLTVVATLFSLVFGVSQNILLSKLSMNAKVGINTVIGIFGGFLSGMMFSQMKFIVLRYLPPLTYINPVNLITDGFLSIEQFHLKSRFYLNVSLLFTYSVILIILSLIKLRREKYESL